MLILRACIVDKVDEKYTKEEGKERGAYIKQRAEAIPLGRVGQPEDISGVVSFLAGPDSRFMTGMASAAASRSEFMLMICRSSHHRRWRYSLRLRTWRTHERSAFRYPHLHIVVPALYTAVYWYRWM